VLPVRYELDCCTAATSSLDYCTTATSSQYLAVNCEPIV
jgi:hypothetical protein